MSARLLTDDLWNEIERFFPEAERSSQGGRPRADNRTVLTCILFVLKTGIAWEDLPLELGCSYKTCKRRMKEWNRDGVWESILHHMLTRLRAAGQLEMADVLVDAGLIKAPLGGENVARTRQIEVELVAS